jgi:hypothetical protein
MFLAWLIETRQCQTQDTIYVDERHVSAMYTIRKCEAEVVRRGVVMVAGMDERGSNPQAGRPLPRDKGHAHTQGGALRTRATVYF